MSTETQLVHLETHRGVYLSVVREGYGAGGDATFAARDERGVTVADIVNVYPLGSDHDGPLRGAPGPSLAETLKNHFRERVSDPG